MPDPKKQECPAEPPSEMFLDAFTDSGGLMEECDYCGRVYFGDETAGDWEKGEREKLLALAKKEPDKYIPVMGMTSTARIEGKIYPWNRDSDVKCPCNALRRHENFVWHYRNQIASYLNVRAEREHKEAKEQMENLRVSRILSGEPLGQEFRDLWKKLNKVKE